jgi:hypothetical protein
MVRIKVPQNVGKVRVVMGLGGKFNVWNGKYGKHEFAIPCKSREHAKEIADIVNKKLHDGEILVSTA